MESCPHGNLFAALHTATKTTTKITKITDDNWCCKENLFLGCILYKQLHIMNTECTVLFSLAQDNTMQIVVACYRDRVAIFCIL